MFTLAAQSSPVNGIVLVLIYALIFGGFWFLFIRPQKKEQKRVQAMIAEMEVGDTVEFGNNKNCRIPMQKAAIAQVEKASAE